MAKVDSEVVKTGEEVSVEVDLVEVDSAEVDLEAVDLEKDDLVVAGTEEVDLVG